MFFFDLGDFINEIGHFGAHEVVCNHLEALLEAAHGLGLAGGERDLTLDLGEQLPDVGLGHEVVGDLFGELEVDGVEDATLILSSGIVCETFQLLSPLVLFQDALVLGFPPSLVTPASNEPFLSLPTDVQQSGKEH